MAVKAGAATRPDRSLHEPIILFAPPVPLLFEWEKGRNQPYSVFPSVIAPHERRPFPQIDFDQLRRIAFICRCMSLPIGNHDFTSRHQLCLSDKVEDHSRRGIDPPDESADRAIDFKRTMGIAQSHQEIPVGQLLYGERISTRVIIGTR